MKKLKNLLNKKTTKTVGIVLAFFVLFASIIYAHPGILHFDFSQKLGVNSQTPTPTIDWSGYNESDIINQINQERSSNKLAEVTTNEKLTKAADDKLDDLIEKNYWENNSPEGTTPWVILESNGYNYEEATMLLARGYNSAKEVVDGWLDSTSKDYLLDKKYSNAGVAIKTGTIQGNSSKLVVLYLASPKVTYTNNTKTTSKNIDCVGPDGKHFQTTQKECEDFNNAWGSTKKSNTSTNNKIPTNIAPINNGKPLITCKVNYPCTGNSYTYQVDADYCNTIQQSAASMCNTFSTGNTTTYVTPTPSQEQMQATVDQYNSNVQSCRNSAVSQYNIAKQNCNVQFGGSSSAGEACLTIAKNNYDSSYQNCGNTL